MCACLNRRKFIEKSGVVIAAGFVLTGCDGDNGTESDNDGNGNESPPSNENPFENKKMACGCHGSLFDSAGNVLSGPATAALISIPVTFSGNIVTVGDPNGVELDLSLQANQALQNVGGAMKVSDVPGQSLPVIVMRQSETLFSAVSSRCTHAGCEISLPT